MIYVTQNYKQDLSKRIVSFTRGSLSVTEYADVFHTLSSRAEVEEILGRFKTGSHKAIRDILQLYTVLLFRMLSKLLFSLKK